MSNLSSERILSVLREEIKNYRPAGEAARQGAVLR